MLPFVITDAGYAFAFTHGLANVLATVMAAILAPLTAIVVLWIIVQGMLVIRGDLDARKGVITIVKHVLVITIVTSALTYSTYVQDAFQTVIPDFVKSMSGFSNIVPIPLQLDAVTGVLEIQFQLVSSGLGPTDAVDASGIEAAQLVMYGSMWATFAVYEIAGIMTAILITIGPLALLGYLFDATKDIATKWVGFLIGYALLTLLVNIVITIVLAAEVTYVSGITALIVLTSPIPSQVLGLYNMDVFLLTGNLILLTLPAVALQLGGNFGAGAGEALGMIARGRSPGAAAAVIRPAPIRPGM